MNNRKNKLPSNTASELLSLLKERFLKNMSRHKGIAWADVESKLLADPQKLWSLNEMESTGGEPDVVNISKEKNIYIFADCAAETPKGRRSVCYDPEALESRKLHKPQHSAMGMAAEMGIEILDEEDYRLLQQLGKFDSKTSSWIKTPVGIRKLGGALFGDYRYGQVFIYHNGAESYYASRSFRGLLRV